MEEVVSHNCAGTCIEEFCDNIETNFIKLDVNGMKFENKFWRKTDEKRH